MIKSLFSNLPNLLDAVSNSALGPKLISTAVAKLTGKDVDPEIVETVIKFANEIKATEGYANISEVILSEKYAGELQSLVTMIAGGSEDVDEEPEHLKITAESAIICTHCNKTNRGDVLIANYKEGSGNVF